MKPKEYIEKYNIGTGWKPEVQKEFLSDLTSELLAICEYNKAEDNIRGFDNSVNVIRMKWDPYPVRFHTDCRRKCGRTFMPLL